MDTSRVQLALNVNDIDEANAFYGKLFDATPHKRRVEYANFTISNPSLKLVLIENPSATTSLGHLGVEVADTEDVRHAADRFMLEQMPTVTEQGVDCGFAVQDKVSVTSPEGEQWEVYTMLDDDGKVGASSGTATTSGCCTTAETKEAVSSACC